MERLLFFTFFTVFFITVNTVSAESIEKTDEAYRTLVPSAPATIPGVSGDSTPEELELNAKYFNHPKACKFYPEDVWDEDDVETSRIKKLSKSSRNYDRNGSELLKKCEQIKNELGEGACSAVVLGGHANGISSGLGKILGFRLTEGKWERFPTDEKIFNNVIQCLKDITYKKAPVIFASCGAAHVYEDYPEEKMRGLLLFYAHKKETQDLLADTLDRTVIGALGPENEQSFGNHARHGWYVAEPTSRKLEKDIIDFRKHLPLAKVRWKNGVPDHSAHGFDWQSEIEHIVE